MAEDADYRRRRDAFACPTVCQNRMSERQPLLDVDALLGSVGGDSELLDELAVTFTEEIPGWITTLRTALASGDAETIFRVAHGVNGAVGYFRASSVQQPAAALEAMGRTRDLTGAAAALDELEAGLLTLGTFLAMTPWRA
jgi:HPt (histidine-containing phosphotransfer) domain-containing protein